MSTTILTTRRHYKLKTLPFVGSPGELIEAVRAERGYKRHQRLLELATTHRLPRRVAARLVDGSIAYTVEPGTGNIQFTMS